MFTLIKNNSWFYLVYTFAVLISSYFILTTNQLQLHQQINQIVGNEIIDVFFKYITHLGDGLFLVFVALILLFFDTKKSLTLLVAYAVSGGITQFLKEVFFNFEMRPYFYHSFYDFPLKIVNGVDMHSQNSFPSGHATAAFCLFTILSFFSAKKIIQFGIALLTIIVSFSRVYLSQHFIEDITAGSLIGIVFSSLVIYFFYFSHFKVKFESIEKPLFQIIKGKNAE